MSALTVNYSSNNCYSNIANGNTSIEGTNTIGSNIRSTRGASKQRRDQINVEIQRLRDLLPLSSSIKERLFQLQVMSLACIFIRKQKYLPHIARKFGINSNINGGNNYINDSETSKYSYYTNNSNISLLPQKIQDISKALKGFLIMVTKSGKLLYISENASEYLGHSVEEIMCQGDSLYDLIDSRDHSAVQAELLSGPETNHDIHSHKQTFSSTPDKVFLCRINLSRTAKRHLQYHKFVLLQGRYMHSQEYYDATISMVQTFDQIQPIFAAYCHPLINPENAEILSNGSTNIFRAVQEMDMNWKEIDHIGKSYMNIDDYEYLNSKDEDFNYKKFYEMIHPDDVVNVANSHRNLVTDKEGSSMCLFRLEKQKSNEYFWVHGVFIIKSSCPTTFNSPDTSDDGLTLPDSNILNSNNIQLKHMIHSTYQILNELEANTLRANLWIYSIKHHIPKELCYVKEGDHNLNTFTTSSCLSPSSSSHKTGRHSSITGTEIDLSSPDIQLYSGNFVDPNNNVYMRSIPTNQIQSNQEAIKVEIPQTSIVHSKYLTNEYYGINIKNDHNIKMPLNLLTPEHSSPDSNCSLPSKNDQFKNNIIYQHVNHNFYDNQSHLTGDNNQQTMNMAFFDTVSNIEGPLPELGDNLDEYFKQVEFSPYRTDNKNLSISPFNSNTQISNDTKNNNINRGMIMTPPSTSSTPSTLSSPQMHKIIKSESTLLNDEWWKNNKSTNNGRFAPYKIDKKSNNFGHRQRHSIQIGISENDNSYIAMCNNNFYNYGNEHRQYENQIYYTSNNQWNTEGNNINTNLGNQSSLNEIPFNQDSYGNMYPYQTNYTSKLFQRRLSDCNGLNN
ncbi:NPAS4 protein [Strongyloides ratti]|uniref:NPAS4 protein n=1 Tax=Strongyloides ratti TaxID=34506 RepID=A0A090MW44_STRRB|nr:NPAS4 protein [Strongyloides ratti]CEF63403.1 NPAS4 protein [Strongyloides ratti]